VRQWKKFKISEHLAKLQGGAWLSHALCVPASTQLNDEGSARYNHVFACNFATRYSPIYFFSPAQYIVAAGSVRVQKVISIQSERSDFCPNPTETSDDVAGSGRRPSRRTRWTVASFINTTAQISLVQEQNATTLKHRFTMQCSSVLERCCRLSAKLSGLWYKTQLCQ